MFVDLFWIKSCDEIYELKKKIKKYDQQNLSKKPGADVVGISDADVVERYL